MDTPCFWHPGPPTAFQPLYTTSLLTWHEMQLQQLHEMQLWLNFSPAHVESCFLSDVHHDSSCFYRSVLNSAGSACGRYRVRSMKSNPCVCAARSVNVAPFGEAGPVWRGSSLNLAGVLHSELVIGRDSESDWLYLKLLFRATHFKSRIQSNIQSATTSLIIQACSSKCICTFTKSTLSKSTLYKTHSTL